jgi:transcriptional regulator with XRE-family HTH domain
MAKGTRADREHGRALRRARQHRKLTQANLARRLRAMRIRGVDAKTISLIERGLVHASSTFFARAARALRMHRHFTGDA